jgi:hypothetical protein
MIASCDDRLSVKKLSVKTIAVLQDESATSRICYKPSLK